MAVKTAPKIFTGKRKSAVARVRLVNGSGIIKVNGREADEYFSGRKSLVNTIEMPFVVTSTNAKYNVEANLCGGGPSAQAEALRHGIAKALLEEDEKNRTPLKKNGFITRDPREVERKKYGKRGARKSFQFSKR